MKTEIFFHDSVFHQSQKGGNAATAVGRFFVGVGEKLRLIKAYMSEVEIFHDGPDLRLRFLVYPLSYVPEAGKVLVPGERPERAILRDTRSIELLESILKGLKDSGLELEKWER
jgi:hypothetical protein